MARQRPKSLWLDIGSAACIGGSEPPAGSVPRAAAQGAKSDQAYTKQRQAGRLWHRGAYSGGKSATDSGMKSATDSDLISAIPI